MKTLLTTLLLTGLSAIVCHAQYSDCCDKYNRIKVIKELWDSGALTEDEFKTEKARILNDEKVDRVSNPGSDAYGNLNGGFGLDLAGWDWDNTPQPKAPKNGPSGRIVFTIEVNDNGELVRYRKESGTLSAAAERACVEAIQKLSFTKKAGTKVPPISKGKITFVIRSDER